MKNNREGRVAISPAIQSEMQDGVLHYQIGDANVGLKGDPLDNDNFYPADGSNGGGVEDADQGFYSEIFGLSRAEREARQKRKDLKAQTKMTAAQAQIAQAKGLATTQADVDVAKALSATPKDTTPKSNNKTLIIAGVSVVALGLIIFAVIKLRKK